MIGNTQQELLAAHVTQTPEPVTKYRESVPPALATETGAGTLISGAVYLEGDSIEIQVDVTDATRGRLIGSPTPVRGTRDAQGQLIGNVQQQVMVFLSVNFDERLRDLSPGLISEAPSYEAYQAFLRGWELQTSGDWEEAIPHYREASDLDSLWAQPLARLHAIFHNAGRLAERDSVVSVLEGLWDRLSHYERAELQYFQAGRAGDREGLVMALRRAVELAPRSPAVNNLALNLMRMNRPSEAREVLMNVDPDRGWWREWVVYWEILGSMNVMLGDHEQALDVARRCRQRHPEKSRCFWPQLQALVVSGEVGDLQGVFDELETRSDFSREFWVLTWSIDFLVYYDRAELAKEVAERAVRWFEDRPPNESARLEYRHEYGRALFFAGRAGDAQTVFDAIVDDFPNDVEQRTRRAFIAATLGDTAVALRDAHFLESTSVELGERQGNKARWWGRGVIHAALGDIDRGWELLSQFEPWWNHSPWDAVRFIYEPFGDHKGFQELMRPKG